METGWNDVHPGPVVRDPNIDNGVGFREGALRTPLTWSRE